VWCQSRWPSDGNHIFSLVQHTRGSPWAQQRGALDAAARGVNGAGKVIRFGLGPLNDAVGVQETPAHPRAKHLEWPISGQSHASCFAGCAANPIPRAHQTLRQRYCYAQMPTNRRGAVFTASLKCDRSRTRQVLASPCHDFPLFVDLASEESMPISRTHAVHRVLRFAVG